VTDALAASQPAASLRDWPRLAEAIGQAARAAGRSLPQRSFIDRLWDHLAPTGVSWLGIYLADPACPDSLLLGPCRDRPACSPIGMHGVCGDSFRQVRPLVVRDIRERGDSYIACDPRDRSELVVPLVDAHGCWGVLDLDSHEVGSFGETDAEGLLATVAAAGLGRHA
jgi:putative methionine-R-sulfoxide reductase with GAF domain